MRLGLASLLVALSCFFCRPLVAVAVTSQTPKNDESALTSPSPTSFHSPPRYVSSSSPESYLSSRQPPSLRSSLLSLPNDADKAGDGTINSIDSFSQILPPALMARKKELTVGYLTTVKGTVSERQGLQVSGAMTMALDEVTLFND